MGGSYHQLAGVVVIISKLAVGKKKGIERETEDKHWRLGRMNENLLYFEREEISLMLSVLLETFKHMIRLVCFK